MKINIKARLKNRTFCVTITTMIVAFVYQVLALFNVVPAVSEDSVNSVIMLIINILATLGIIVDPTTEGINDSERAMTYCTDEDVRETENEEG